MNRRLGTLWLLVGLAVLAYFHGLDSLHVPKNGDEYVYAHITRLTAASGELLPLQSEIEGMRNTKPPMLFWQGIISTDGGDDWALWRLRAPNVVYTLLIALLAGLLGWRLSERVESGILAGLAYLAFLTTYRYGRPFLTNAPEIFWLFLPFFVLLFWRPRSFDSWILPVLIGLSVGIGLFYKSVMLLVPVGLALAWWHLDTREYRIAEFIRKDVAKLVLVAVLAVGVFGLWFVLDPDPGAVWEEFILKENIGKVDRGNYWLTALWGGNSIWVFALRSILENPGLFMFPVAALFYISFRNRKLLSPGEKLLWIWILTFFLVFCIPSQRSPRYLLPVMPAVAVLLAVSWDRIPRGAFKATAGLAVLFITIFGLISFRVASFPSEETIYPFWHWLVLLGGLSAAIVAFFRQTRMLALTAVFLTFLSFSSFLYPFDKVFGEYDEAVRQSVAGKEIWVPMNFKAKFERYYFLLPEADIHGYWSIQGEEAPVGDFPIVAVQLPPGDEADFDQSRILGERWDLRTRQSSAELERLFLEGDLDGLLTREYLVASP